MPGTFTLDQDRFRIRNDDGSETTATWKAALNTNASLEVDTNWRIRFTTQETGGADGTPVAQLQYNLAGAGWNNVSAASSVARASASPNLADGTATTAQLGTPAPADPTDFVAGSFDEVDGTGASMSLMADKFTEHEYCFQIRSADVTNGQTIQLRLVNTATVYGAYTNTPTITVVEAAAVLVTPPTLALVLATFAPTVSAPRLVTPPTLALVLTTFAPTVSAPRLVTPPTLALVLTTFAPTVPAPRLVTPPTLALVLTTFAPVVSAGVRITPPTLALVLTTFAPVITTPRLVTPPTLALILTPFAPTISAPRLVTPPTLALILTTFAPTVSAPRLVTPPTLALSLTTFAPTVAAPRLVTPPTLALVLTTFAPMVTAPRLVTPPTLALTLTTFAPTVTVGAGPPAPVSSARPRRRPQAFAPTVIGRVPSTEPVIIQPPVTYRYAGAGALGLAGRTIYRFEEAPAPFVVAAVGTLGIGGRSEVGRSPIYVLARGAVGVEGSAETLLRYDTTLDDLALGILTAEALLSP